MSIDLWLAAKETIRPFDGVARRITGLANVGRERAWVSINAQAAKHLEEWVYFKQYAHKPMGEKERPFPTTAITNYTAGRSDTSWVREV